MPPKLGCRRDDERRPLHALEQPVRRCQERPIRGREWRPTDSPTQHGQLVAKHDDLQILQVTGTKPEDYQLQNAVKCDVADRQKHGASLRKMTAPPFYADRLKTP